MKNKVFSWNRVCVNCNNTGTIWIDGIPYPCPICITIV